MRAWRVHGYGGPLSALSLDEVPVPNPETGEVLVRAGATVLDYNDVDGCHGRYRTVQPELPYTLGMESVGTVEAAGPGAEDWIGRRVMTTTRGATGGYAEFAVGPTAMTFPVPDSMSDEEAAAFYFPYHVAGLALIVRGRLREGETVLIHAAAGGVGSAALQLARALGARVITTCGGPAKVAFCRELGADRAIDYHGEDFVEVVLDETGGDGVDVVLDTVGGDVTEKSWRCIAFGGRHLIAGFSGGIETEDEPWITPRPLVFGNFDLIGVIMAYQDDPKAIKRATGYNFVDVPTARGLHERLISLFESGAIRPVIGSRIPFESIPAGLDALARRATTGRTVVLFGEA